MAKEEKGKPEGTPGQGPPHDPPGPPDDKPPVDPPRPPRPREVG